MKYSATVTRTETRTTFPEVEARNEVEAARIAERMAKEIPVRSMDRVGLEFVVDCGAAN